MDWKVRKDKRKDAAPETDAPVENAPRNGESSDQPEESTPVFDLSGDAFRPISTGLDNQSEPIVLGSESEDADTEPIALEPLPVEPVETDPSTAAPKPRFDLDSPPGELKAIAVPPSAELLESSPEDQGDSEPRFDASPERESIASGLVTTESDMGLPKVAPFIVDVDPTQKTSEKAMANSIVIRIGKLSATYLLTKDVTTIGRPDTIVQNYPDVEIELDDGVSRRHAEIRRHDGQYVITDVGSTNGTLLNGEKLAPNEEIPLHSGDRIHLGERTELIFE